MDSEPDAGSHHPPGSRLLTSFVGGLDLCNGRYDDEAHSLFRSLTTLHSEDMHQPCIPGAEIKFGGELLVRRGLHVIRTMHNSHGGCTLCSSRPCSKSWHCCLHAKRCRWPFNCRCQSIA